MQGIKLNMMRKNKNARHKINMVRKKKRKKEKKRCSKEKGSAESKILEETEKKKWAQNKQVGLTDQI